MTTRVSARVPADVLARWREQAADAGLNFSDWLRQAVDGDRVPLTGKPTPRRRPKSVTPSKADPALMRQLTAVGGNINQIARGLNRQVASGQEINVLEALIVLRRMEEHLDNIARVHSDGGRDAH